MKWLWNISPLLKRGRVGVTCWERRHDVGTFVGVWQPENPLTLPVVSSTFQRT